MFVTPLKRTAGLDGLRGLAALTVALGHFFRLFPDNRFTSFWKYSPAYMLIAGREAVVVFFVLSGFALHRMLAGRKSLYWRFALRRVIRIYGPYLGALALAVAGNLWLSAGPRVGFSSWFNQTWPIPVDFGNVSAHILFLGDYNTFVLNGAFWSLIHEMRISLVFPLLDCLVRGRSIVLGVSLALAMIIAGSLINAHVHEPNNLGETLHYCGLFVAGILIAEQSSVVIRPQWLIAAALLFYSGRGVSRLFPVEYADLLDIPVGCGAAVIVMWATNADCLLAAPIQWFGQRSFSLYLIHIPVLLGLVNLLNMTHPSIWLVFLYVPVTLGVAELFYRVLERPSLRLSQQLAR